MFILRIIYISQPVTLSLKHSRKFMVIRTGLAHLQLCHLNSLNMLFVAFPFAPNHTILGQPLFVVLIDLLSFLVLIDYLNRENSRHNLINIRIASFYYFCYSHIYIVYHCLSFSSLSSVCLYIHRLVARLPAQRAEAADWGCIRAVYTWLIYIVWYDMPWYNMIYVWYDMI